MRLKIKASQPINSPLTAFATNYFSAADDLQIQDESAGEATHWRLCQCDKPLAVCVLSVFLTVDSWQFMLGFFALNAGRRFPVPFPLLLEIFHLNSKGLEDKVRSNKSCAVVSVLYAVGLFCPGCCDEEVKAP